MNFIYRNKSFFLKLKRHFNRIFNIELLKYPTPELDRKVKLLNFYKIDVVLDVGANIGQFGSELRNIGYKGRIISFEPTINAFKKLKKLANNDINWEVHHLSLGEKDGETTINLSENSVSSSILESLPELTAAAPKAKFINTEHININQLDTIFYSLGLEGKRIFMKMDTQGYEKNILEGAKNSLKKIIGIQLEMALLPTYQNALNFDEMHQYVTDLGFKLESIESGYSNQQTGQLLEVDGIYFKK
jgi:FkbM family methyltransferase